MKSAVRYTDAHTRWMPKFDIIKRLPNPANKPEPPPKGNDRTIAVAPAIADDPNAVIEAHTIHGGKPHPWKQRRTDVLNEFRERVLPRVYPIGYSEAYSPDDPLWNNGHSLDATDAVKRATELKWLEDTQHLELPPEWLMLRSNGITADSIDTLIEHDDGPMNMVEMMQAEPNDWERVYITLQGLNRAEAFLKQQDERQWHSGRPRRYVTAVNDDGKRGLVPQSRYTKPEQVQEDFKASHLPCPTVIRLQMEHRKTCYTTFVDGRGRTQRLAAQGAFAPRADAHEKFTYTALDALEGEREGALEERVPQDSDDYAPATPCPNEACSERGDDCVVCQGTKRVSHTLGMDSEADWPPPGWLRTPQPRATRKARGIKTR